MVATPSRVVAIYVDRSTRRWVVRDADGHLWVLPTSEHPWDDREPFSPDEETDFEPVPGHYRYMLGLPF